MKEELARIGRDDPEIETFAKKAFTEAGRLRDGLSEAMSKARRAAAGGGGGGDYDERDPRVLPLVRRACTVALLLSTVYVYAPLAAILMVP